MRLFLLFSALLLGLSLCLDRAFCAESLFAVISSRPDLSLLTSHLTSPQYNESEIVKALNDTSAGHYVTLFAPTDAAVRREWKRIDRVLNASGYNTTVEQENAKIGRADINDVDDEQHSTALFTLLRAADNDNDIENITLPSG